MIDFDNKKKIVSTLLDNGIVISEDIFEILDDNFDIDSFNNVISKELISQVLFLNKDVVNLFNNNIKDINWNEFEKIKSKAERDNDFSLYNQFLGCVNEKINVGKCSSLLKKSNSNINENINDINSNDVSEKINVIFNYDEPLGKKEVKDFVAYFNARFKAIEAVLRNRQELTGLTSIARILNKKDRENVALIGMVESKHTTTNGHIILTLEDTTGKIKVLINNTKQEEFEIAKNIVLDEVIGVNGVSGNGIVFTTNLYLPDIPLHKELKKCPEEKYAIFLSDIHVGSEHYLEDKFNKFIRWINGEIGTEEHKKIVKKIKYLFIVGDLVDGVGIYPRQDDELVIKDIYDQYTECARLLSLIPKHIKIVICPGNHDSIRMSEPQPAFDPEFAKPLYEIPNVQIISNPGYVNISATDDFPGFDVLLYHGYCFDYFISNVDNIRNNGGYDRADLVMKFLLQRRHLAPSHSSTLYIPDPKQDPLFISKIPDFFISGHIHKSYVANYRNITLICGSCWQSTTPFQEKVGHHPEPAQVPMVNLQTRQTKVLKF